MVWNYSGSRGCSQGMVTSSNPGHMFGPHLYRLHPSTNTFPSLCLAYARLQSYSFRSLELYKGHLTSWNTPVLCEVLWVVSPARSRTTGKPSCLRVRRLLPLWTLNRDCKPIKSVTKVPFTYVNSDMIRSDYYY